jgi:hypothetical protein
MKLKERDGIGTCTQRTSTSLGEISRLKVKERDYCTELRMDTYIQELIEDYRLPELCQWSTLTPQEAHQADEGANATGPGAGYGRLPGSPRPDCAAATPGNHLQPGFDARLTGFARQGRHCPSGGTMGFDAPPAIAYRAEQLTLHIGRHDCHCISGGTIDIAYRAAQLTLHIWRHN